MQNGYSDVYGYLGQYFEQAYKVDANGNVTSNTTGVLSCYGSFYATEPGDVALVTMPDLDTGERGKGIVHCVSLQVDKNHDGEMNLSFAGDDATSQANPMVFWVNNDYDLASQPGYPAYDPGSDKPVSARWSDQYFKDYLESKPNSIRDLEDWARLWICGVPALTNGTYQVTMSWRNVSSNPAINIIRSCETDGGSGYLTATNIAWQQSSFMS
jgi:hypothetical protein